MTMCAVLASVVAMAHAGCTIGPVSCYSDNETRILGNKNYNTQPSLSLEYCAQICKNAGLPLAGAENGVECYCGESLASNAKPSPLSDCSMKCDYINATEDCGGDWRISVFNYTCSGDPVPVPPHPAQPPEMVNPCIGNTRWSSLPFCNQSLSIDARVEDMLSRMTQDEKFGILDTGGRPVPSLGLNGYNWWSEASTGVASGRYTQTTKFAFPITTGMSFNRSLWQLTGRQIGMEARAMMNAGNGFSTFWAPVINLAREPRWARNIETPGEDPYHSGEYAEWYVKGMEQNPSDEGHIQASACCKHYVANSMDGTTQHGIHHDRNHYNAEITQQDLVDSYMLPFQACVEKGRVSGLMCSYNAVNGVPSCANDWLLNQVARGDWGFDGYVTSDCDADNDVVFSHHYTDIPEQGVQDVLRAGTDVDCGGFVGKYIANATATGYVTMDDVDTVLARLFKVRVRLGHFDQPGPLQQIPEDVICSDYALDLSNDGVTQAAALLKNDGTLPLSKSNSARAVVIGPNANLSKSDAGYYGPHNVCGGNFWTLVDAVANGIPTVSSVLGVPSVLSNDVSGIPAATAAAAAADQVILAVGTDLSWAAEGHDATNINFTQAQKWLIGNVTKAAKKNVVLVLFTATPLDLTDELANDKIGAILHVGQPSVTILGADKLLFGDVSPAGRTVQTFYPDTYIDEISIFDFNMRPGSSPFPRPDCGLSDQTQCPNGTNPGRTYRFYTGKPVVPFGFGLSYTTFKYEVVSAPSKAVSLDAVRDMLKQTEEENRVFPSVALVESAEAVASYVVNVTNTGKMDADDVVLGFITPPESGQNGVPLKQLFGFERVHVKAGETVSVYLYPALTDFSQVDLDGRRYTHSGDYKISFGVAETAIHGQGFVEHSLATF